MDLGLTEDARYVPVHLDDQPPRAASGDGGEIIVGTAREGAAGSHRRRRDHERVEIDHLLKQSRDLAEVDRHETQHLPPRRNLLLNDLMVTRHRKNACASIRFSTSSASSVPAPATIAILEERRTPLARRGARPSTVHP